MTSTVEFMTLLKDIRRMALFDQEEAAKEMSRTVTYHRNRREPEEIDRLLDSINVEEWPNKVLQVLLIATAAVATDLSKRDAFAARVRGKFAAAMGEKKATEELMGLT